MWVVTVVGEIGEIFGPSQSTPGTGSTYVTEHLYCIVLNCIVLYCIVLYCIVL